MKERWPEMLEYQQKVQAMTDLERAHAFMERHIFCQLTICSCVTSCGCAAEIAALIAAARREGAEAERNNIDEMLDVAYREGAEAERNNIDEMLDVAYHNGAEEMRERTAKTCSLMEDRDNFDCAAAIRALKDKGHD